MPHPTMRQPADTLFLMTEALLVHIILPESEQSAHQQWGSPPFPSSGCLVSKSCSAAIGANNPSNKVTACWAGVLLWMFVHKMLLSSYAMSPISVLLLVAS